MAGFHNPRSDSSEKSAENSALPVDSAAARRQRFAMTEAMQAACRLVKILGLVPSFRNLYIIELAIRAESNFSAISVQEAEEAIIANARAALRTGECLDYFWFEDCRWRNPKLTFKQRDDLQMREKARNY